MMAIPNLIGLLLLSKVIKDETNRYFAKMKK
jgi:Na+/alanine symporter